MPGNALANKSLYRPAHRIVSMDNYLSVSLVIPAWNESERIIDCIENATKQSMPAKEVIVTDNMSTDNTRQLVRDYIDSHPNTNVILLEQNEKQGLIPTRNYGIAHATGDIIGRFDADCMIRPNWVETVSRFFTENPEIMGATGPVTYYDMPARKVSLKGDAKIRTEQYTADGGEVLLFGSNMAVRATAWEQIKDEVCADEKDIFHEDIDVSLHLMDNNLKTGYCPQMVNALSARRMDTSITSFFRYMKRFKNTFDAHPNHWQSGHPEISVSALYPWLHMLYPIYQKYLKSREINPAEQVWLEEQIELLHKAEEAGQAVSDIASPEEN